MSNDFSLDMHQLLTENRGVYIHTKHLQLLMIEVFKTVNELNPELLWELFKLKKTTICDRRCHQNLVLPPTRTITYGTNSLLYNASALWNSLHNKFKCLESLSMFKDKIKSWYGAECKCNLCK